MTKFKYGYQLANHVTTVMGYPHMDTDLRNLICGEKENGADIGTMVHAMMAEKPSLKGTMATAIVERVYWGHQPSWDWCGGYTGRTYSKLPGGGKPATSHCGRGRGRNARKKEAKLRANARSVGHGVSRYKIRQLDWWKTAKNMAEHYRSYIW